MDRAAISERGFTLIETLVAVFALALLMSAGGALLISTLNSQRAIDTRLERLDAIEIASAHLRADLAHTLPRVVETGLDTTGPQSLFGGEAGRDGLVLGLVRGGWINPGQTEDRGDLLALDYRVEGGALIRRVYQRPDRTRQTRQFDTALLTGLAEVDVNFIANDLVAERWELVLESGTPRLPEAVSVDFVFETGERLTQTFLVGGRPS